MKTIILVLYFAIGFAACLSSPTTQQNVIKRSNLAEKCIGVKGMTCVGCEVTLEDQVSKIKGVVSVKASASDDEATILYDSTQTDFLTITTAIKEAGYKTTSLKNK